MIKFKTVRTPWSAEGFSLQWITGSYNTYWFNDQEEWQENIDELNAQGHNFSYGTEQNYGVAEGRKYIQLLSIGRHKTVGAAATIRYFYINDTTRMYKHDCLTPEEYAQWITDNVDKVYIFSVAVLPTVDDIVEEVFKNVQ